MTKSICIVCGKEDDGISWQLMPVHPACRREVTSPLTYDEQIIEFNRGGGPKKA